MLLQCPPHPIHPANTHTPPSMPLMPPLTPNNQSMPMGACFGCLVFLTHLHIPSSSSSYKHEKCVPRDAFFVFVAPTTPPSAAEHRKCALVGVFLVFGSFL